MREIAPLAVILLCFLSCNALAVVLYRQLREQLQGTYPFGLGVIGRWITVSPDEAQFFKIIEQDKPLIEAMRKKLFVGVVILLALSFVALIALHRMFP